MDIKTSFGLIITHIFLSNIPFLFSLQNIKKIKIILNIINNIFI